MEMRLGALGASTTLHRAGDSGPETDNVLGVTALNQRIHERCACGSSLSSYRGDTDSNFALAGTQRVYERPRPFRIRHIALDLTLDHKRSQLVGNAELLIDRVDQDAEFIHLDAIEFDIESVRLAPLQGRQKRAKRWRKTEFDYDGERLEVPIPANARRLLLEVKYRTAPRRGMYFLRPDKEVPDRPSQIWTQCQDEDARFIFPCHDKPHIRQTIDFCIRVKSGWFVLCNGQSKSSKREQRSGIFRYSMKNELPTYLVSIVAGEFATVDDSFQLDDRLLPVHYLVPKGREADARRTFANTPAMIRLFAERTGVPYPWSKYHQVVVSDFIFGGMENTGATTMYEHILIDKEATPDLSSDDLIAHELAHQWFGDLVTCRDWSHAWLNEGFATYFEHVWREHQNGRDDYLAGLEVDLKSYLYEARSRYKRPVVCQDYAAPIDIFDRHLYEKGALILHALRIEVGDNNFWQGIRLYLERHRNQIVETRDLWRALEEVSGKSLQRFFEQTVFRADYPQIHVNISYSRGLLTLTTRQTLSKDARPFSLCLDMEIGLGKSRKVERYQRQISDTHHTFVFKLEHRPRFVVIDGEQRIVGSVRSKAPVDMLKAQLREAPSGRGRRLAATALGARNEPSVIEALAKTLRKTNEFWKVRAAAAAALGRIASPDAFAALAKACRIRQPKVRRAVVQALGNFRTAEAVQLLAARARGDESILVAASACRSLGSTKQEEAFYILSDLIDKPSWADSLRSAAIGGLARLRLPKAADLVLERSRYGYPNRSRRVAIGAIAKLCETGPAREKLCEQLEDPNPHVRVSTVLALAELDDSTVRSTLSRQLEKELDGRVRRRIRETLSQLSDKGSGETKKLRDEIESLRREQRELKTRLSKLEARGN